MKTSMAFSLTASPAQDWRDEFLLKAVQQPISKTYMFLLLDLVKQQYELADPSATLNRLSQAYLQNSPDDDDTVRTAMRDTMNLMAFFAELRSLFQCFDEETGYVEIVDGKQEGGCDE